MRCLDHIDMVAMAGAAAVLGSAAFFFAYLGVERGPLTAPPLPSASAVIESELTATIHEAEARAANVAMEQAQTQTALGEAIVRLAQVQTSRDVFPLTLAAGTAGIALSPRTFLEDVYKLPADWRSPEFQNRLRRAESQAQPRLGAMIVSGAKRLDSRLAEAEVAYGNAFLAAAIANERAATEPAASRATVRAATAALTALAPRTAAVSEPVIEREPSRGFGSIGDGTILPVSVFAGLLMLVLAAGKGVAERGATTRTMEAYCETAGREVEVKVLVGDDTPYEVVRCSAFNGGPVTCGKHCLEWETAHAAA